MAHITFYYDGSCPSCRGFVTSMQKRDKEGRVQWHDFQNNLGDLAISHEEAVKQPLARDEAGELLRGMDAILRLWEELGFYKLTVPTLGNPLVKPLFTLYYQTYAEWRPRKHTCHPRHGCRDV